MSLDTFLALDYISDVLLGTIQLFLAPILSRILQQFSNPEFRSNSIGFMLFLLAGISIAEHMVVYACGLLRLFCVVILVVLASAQLLSFSQQNDAQEAHDSNGEGPEDQKEDPDDQDWEDALE